MYGEIGNITKTKARRNPLQIIPVLAGILVPTMMFTSCFWCMSFSLRHYRARFAYTIGPIASLVVCLWVTLMTYKHKRQKKHTRGLISWSIMFWSAFIAGTVSGEINYQSYSYSYYSYMDLLSYPNIDPQEDRGQSYMDAGIIYFKESTVVAKNKAIAFQSTAIYCAAPIIRQPLENQDGADSVETEGPIKMPASGTVDWWAVGINCCEPSGNGFACGEVNNPMARSGIRMLREDARPFFLMAVQEWDSWLGLPSKHPLFFYWVTDPLTQIDGHLVSAKKEFFTQVFGFLMYSAVVTIALLFLMDHANVK